MKEYSVEMRGDLKLIRVDTKLAKYQGIRWKELSEFQRRKYENFVFLSNNERNKIKVIYK